MEKMKSLRFVAAFSLLAAVPFAAEAAGNDPEGNVVYALPSTSVRIKVEARQDNFHAGPYAKFAAKYLGIEASAKDAVTYDIVSVKMMPCVEADLAKRYTIAPSASMPAFLSMTTQGLISVSLSASEETEWRFPVNGTDNFQDKGISSNLTSEEATLYRNVKKSDTYSKVPVRQEMVVEKSVESKAKEAAETIFSLRNKRLQIITGDTDATFSGEALDAAVTELARMEKEYMSLFIGYHDYSTQSMTYEVIPSPDNDSQIYVAFRVSDAKGLVPAGDMSGKPYLVEFDPSEVSVPQARHSSSRGNVVHYRIPATCDVRLTDGVNVLLQTRMPIYQLGVESTFPIVSK